MEMNQDTVLPGRDHDMLVGLNIKVDQLTTQISELKDNSLMRIAKAESRLDAIDVYHATVNQQEVIATIEWTKSFRSNVKLIATLGGVTLATLGGLIGNLIQKWFKL